jgi:uncharacterized sporulation protein YeaH/YhbH (DUF444 family)
MTSLLPSITAFPLAKPQAPRFGHEGSKTHKESAEHTAGSEAHSKATAGAHWSAQSVDASAAADQFVASSSMQNVEESQPVTEALNTTAPQAEKLAHESRQGSPWLKVLDDMIASTSPEQESVNGIPVAELVYMREKIRRAPNRPPVDEQGKARELYPCPFQGPLSKPWAALDRETIGSDHPDSKRFWDIVDGKNTPKDLLDKISKRQVKIGPKGQISFPSPTIKRPKIWWGQPGSQQSKKGQQGQNGQPKPGPGVSSQPGKKPGDVIGKKPGDGKGPGEGHGEGEGDYPKESWTPPVPRSQVGKLLQAEWGLPFIKPRGLGKMKEVREIWDQTTTTPPNLIERQPTLKNAIQRSYGVAWYDKQLKMEERIQNGMHPSSPAIPNHKITITGNTLVGSSSLHKAVAPFQGKDLAYEDLAQILTQLDKKYQAMGFASSKAIIPAQRLDSGELKIDVREVRDNFTARHIKVHAKDMVRIAAREDARPVAKTALIYIMDVSGSVSNEMKEMARVQNYFLDTHLMHQYGLVAAELAHEKYDDKKHFGQGVARRFIVHTDGAQEATEEEFYTTGQSGGTRISSGFELAKEMINKNFPTNDWNVYIFYQGDGDNIGGDNDKSIKLMTEFLDQGVNMIGYTHLAPIWSGGGSTSDGLGRDNFLYEVRKKLTDRPNVRTSILHKPEISEYQQSIKRLLEESPSGAKK